MTMREDVSELLLSLRGDVTRSALAERLGISRQAVMKLEQGSVSLERLDELAGVYGVEFHLVATLPGAEMVTRHIAVGSPAPGLRDLAS